VGTVPTCLTGPLNAIIAGGSKDKVRHYTAAVLVCIGVMIFGLLAPFFIGLMLATPKAFIMTLAGIALLKVLQGAFVSAFQGAFSLGALIAFMVTVSDLLLLNIGAPFWGLVFGCIASLVLERGSNVQH
jgi:benzoate membrane transport protein